MKGSFPVFKELTVKYKALRILVGRKERVMGGREKDFSQMAVKGFELRDQLSG